MNLNSAYGVADDQLFPEGVGGGTLGKDLKDPFNDAETVCNLLYGQAVTAACGWRSRASVPKLCDILEGNGERFALALQKPQGGANVRVVRIRAVKETQENACINQDGH
jgi:hypothetical protein